MTIFTDYKRVTLKRATCYQNWLHQLANGSFSWIFLVVYHHFNGDFGRVRPAWNRNRTEPLWMTPWNPSTRRRWVGLIGPGTEGLKWGGWDAPADAILSIPIRVHVSVLFGVARFYPSIPVSYWTAPSVEFHHLNWIPLLDYANHNRIIVSDF